MSAATKGSRQNKVTRSNHRPGTGRTTSNVYLDSEVARPVPGREFGSSMMRCQVIFASS